MVLAQIEMIIPALAFVSVMLIGSAVIVSRSAKRKLIKERIADKMAVTPLTEQPPAERSGVLLFFEKLGNFASHSNPSTNLLEQLVRAGYYHQSAVAVYTGIKLLLFAIGLSAGALLIIPLSFHISAKITLVFLVAAILFFLPNIIVMARLKKRHNEIRLHLPIMIDLLEICVSSGIGLDMAWNVVADEIRHVSIVLSNSMALTSFEMHLGASRVEAMRSMSKRTGVDELSSLSAILIQTEKFGTSVADTLRVFAQSMREERSHTAQENAEKMSVKLLIPMILFIFPAVVIVAAGPAVISIGKALTYGQ